MKVDYNIDFVLLWMNSWSSNMSPDIKVVFSILVEQNLFCLALALGIYYFRALWGGKEKMMSQCQLCSWAKEQGEEETPARCRHIKHKHNIFKFISCFKYILHKEEGRLTLKERHLRNMVLAKQVQIFN